METAFGDPDAVPELVEQALRNGGPKSDNVSILAMEWESAEDSETPGISTQSLGEEVFARLTKIDAFAISGEGRSGLPKPRSTTSRPARRASRLSPSMIVKTYGGRPGIRRNSIPPG